MSALTGRYSRSHWHAGLASSSWVGSLLLLLIALPCPIQAQTLEGRVLESGSDSSLSDVVVRLLDSSGKSVAVVVSDAEGHYALSAPAPGEYLVSAEQLGYEDTRSPLLALASAEGTYRVDIELQISPLGLPGLDVTTDRLEVIEDRLHLLVGVRPSSLRTPPILRPTIEHHLARNHSLEDLIRTSNLPSLTVVQTRDGPCFLFRVGSRAKIPGSCVKVFLDGAPLTLESVPLLPLDLAEVIVIVRPAETILYERGAILLYSKGWVAG